MHTKSSFLSLLAAGALLYTAPAFAQHDHHGSTPKTDAAANKGQLIRVTKKDAAWAAKERASYPLEVCVSSDEKLGSMGKAPEYIYRVNGQPDRLVVFCCAGCDEDFLSDPAKHLAKIDAAKKAKVDAKQTSGHAAHH